MYRGFCVYLMTLVLPRNKEALFCYRIPGSPRVGWRALWSLGTFRPWKPTVCSCLGGEGGHGREGWCWCHLAWYPWAVMTLLGSPRDSVYGEDAKGRGHHTRLGPTWLLGIRGTTRPLMPGKRCKSTPFLQNLPDLFLLRAPVQQDGQSQRPT